MASLCSESSRSYSGRSASVPVSKACLKGGADGVTHSVRAEVSRGHSTQPPSPMATGRAEGDEQVRIRASRDVAFKGTRTTVRWPIIRGDCSAIQRLGDAPQGVSLKLVANRLVRTRTLGGVGGVPGNRAPGQLRMWGFASLGFFRVFCR